VPVDLACHVGLGEGKRKNMKGFADKLSKEEIGAVVEYIHTLHPK